MNDKDERIARLTAHIQGLERALWPFVFDADHVDDADRRIARALFPDTRLIPTVRPALEEALARWEDARPEDFGPPRLIFRKKSVVSSPPSTEDTQLGKPH